MQNKRWKFIHMREGHYCYHYNPYLEELYRIKIIKDEKYLHHEPPTHYTWYHFMVTLIVSIQLSNEWKQWFCRHFHKSYFNLLRHKDIEY